MVAGVTFHTEDLQRFSPGFYIGEHGAQYFCLSEFLAEYGLLPDLDFIHLVLDEVMREFPAITVIEFSEDSEDTIPKGRVNV